MDSTLSPFARRFGNKSYFNHGGAIGKVAEMISRGASEVKEIVQLWVLKIFSCPLALAMVKAQSSSIKNCLLKK